MTANKFDHDWHCAINREADRLREAGVPWPRFMYEAKKAWHEVPRLTRLFRSEREGTLRTQHKQCSQSGPVPVPDNHLTCCLGKKCAECPFLQAIDRSKAMSDAQKDEAKAWTCVAHILENGGDIANEGYVLTVDDRMYWGRVYENLACPEGLG